MRPDRLKLLFLTTLPVVVLVGVGLGVMTARGVGPPSPSTSSIGADGSGSSVTGPRISTGESATHPSDASSTTAKRRVASRIIQWITDQAPLGGGAEGPQDEAFSAILDGDCAEALELSGPDSDRDRLEGPQGTLYEGAGAACLAAFDGRPRLWPRAEAAFARLAGQTAQLDCQQQTVYRLLERMIDAHRADPDARLVRQIGGRRGVLPCPRFLRLIPDHGASAGGYPVRIEGVHLPRSVRLFFGDHRLTAISKDGRHVVVTAPPATDPGDLVSVHPDEWPFGLAHNPWFQYGKTVANAQPSGSTRPSSSTTPSSTTSSSTGSAPSSS
jgi:hypothetical protein